MRALVVVALAAVGCSTSVNPPAAPSSPPTDGRPKIESDVYKRWARFKPGAVVEYAERSDIPGSATLEQTTTYKLKAIKADKAVVEVTVVFKEADGTLAANPTQEFKYFRWVPEQADRTGDKEGLPAGTTGPEAVAVAAAGREFPARLYKSKGHVEAGPTEIGTWLCDEVPGGLLKSVTTVTTTKRVTTAVVSRIVTP